MHARADELGINLSNLIIEGLVAVGVELPPDGKRQRGPRRWRLTDPETQNAAANR